MTIAASDDAPTGPSAGRTATPPLSRRRAHHATDRPARRVRRSALGLLALATLAPLALAALAAPLAAQRIEGVALGPDGAPLPDVPVALHRVGGGAGAFAASTAADADGRFSFEIEAADSALYFAAMRYDGRMYIGPAITGGTGDVTGYELRADPDAEAGAVASALAGTPGRGGMTPGAAMPAPTPRPRGADDTGALWIVLALAVVAAAVFLTTAPAARRRRTRDTLVRLATVENRLAADPDADERAALEARRARLRGRLAPRG